MSHSYLDFTSILENGSDESEEETSPCVLSSKTFQQNRRTNAIIPPTLQNIGDLVDVNQSSASSVTSAGWRTRLFATPHVVASGSDEEATSSTTTTTTTTTSATTITTTLRY